MEITQPEPISLLSKILYVLERQRALSNETWGIEDIADYLGKSPATVQRHFIGKGNFPEPHELPTGGTRWEAREVRAWFERLPRNERRKD